MIAAHQFGRARGGFCSNPALLRHWPESGMRMNIAGELR
jgi:hypothetical protein